MQIKYGYKIKCKKIQLLEKSQISIFIFELSFAFGTHVAKQSNVFFVTKLTDLMEENKKVVLCYSCFRSLSYKTLLLAKLH